MSESRSLRTGKFSIRSAREALRLSKALPSIWSQETLLTQRLLIYIAELLEEKARPKRKPSEWQRFFAQRVKAGLTAKQAAEEWRSRR